MKAGPVVIGTLLHNRVRYCVPIYQRHYVWSRERQLEPFWTDIRTKAIERLAGRERRFSHFMGAVVLESRGAFSARRVQSFQVVDGQQRLTTFQLFLAAARDYAISIGYTSAAASIETYLLNQHPQLMESPDVEVFKVWPTTADRAMFTDIIGPASRDDLRQKYSAYFFKHKDAIYDYTSTPRLLAAYGYFFDRIRHSSETDDLDDEFADDLETHAFPEIVQDARDSVSREVRLDALWQSLVEEFKVVEISLDEGDDAQVIFETLNERGEPLLAADLVRNNIFQRAESTAENAEVLFESHWKQFEDPFWSEEERQGRYRKARIEFFLIAYIAGHIPGEVNSSKIFSEYKALNQRAPFASVSDEIGHLNRYGRLYQDLVTHRGDEPLALFGQRLQPWEMTTVYPFALRIGGSEELTIAEKHQCLDAVISYIVRRAVCGLTNRAYNKFFLNAIAYLNSSGWAKAHFIDFMLNQTADSNRFPRDDEFFSRWLTNPLYRMLGPVRVRAILAELERARRTRFHETMHVSENLTVEHILPSEWMANWPLPDGSAATPAQLAQAQIAPEDQHSPVGLVVRRDRIKHTIGNLTLLTQPLNSSMSNAPYASKRNALLQHSLLVLNREVTQLNEWDESSISARGEDLFKTAVVLWPTPQVGAPPDAS